VTVQSQPKQTVLKILSQKTLHKNRAGGVAQGEALSSSPNSPVLQKKKKKEQDHKRKKTKKIIKGYGCGSSGRALEFKPSSAKQNKINKKTQTNKQQSKTA
jgi:hypothetical protein